MASGRRRSQLLSQIPGVGPSMLVMKTPAAEGFSVGAALDGGKGEAGRYYARNEKLCAAYGGWRPRGSAFW
jgi:hypothetical protein